MKSKSNKATSSKKKGSQYLGWSALTGTWIARPVPKKGATITRRQVRNAMRALGLIPAK
jgi:hypothetical protein